MIDDGDYGAIGGIKIGRGNRSTRRKPAPLSTTNPTLPEPGSNPGRRGGNPATNCLSYGAALQYLNENMGRDVLVTSGFHQVHGGSAKRISMRAYVNIWTTLLTVLHDHSGSTRVHVPLRKTGRLWGRNEGGSSAACSSYAMSSAESALFRTCGHGPEQRDLYLTSCITWQTTLELRPFQNQSPARHLMTE
jgi:hypothetical protein